MATGGGSASGLFRVWIRVLPDVLVIQPGDADRVDRRPGMDVEAWRRVRARWSERRGLAAGRTTSETLALAGAMWSVVFALAHFYWAVGGRLGTAANLGAISDRPMFLAYDLAAGLTFLGAGAVATVLARGVAVGRLRSRLLTATGWGAVVALVRGVGGLAQDALSVAWGDRLGVGVAYDLWFAVAGVVFLVAARGLRRQDPVR